MAVDLNRINLIEPGYYHREFQNDLAKRDPNDRTPLNQLFRVAQVALPFVALYKPFGKSLTLMMGGSRILSTISKTYSDVSEGKDRAEIASDMFQTSVAVISFAGTIFAHPLGMLVTTCHDLGINVLHLHQAWVEKDSAKAIDSGLQLLNNTVYLGMFFIGSTELQVASLAIQILVGLHKTSDDFKKGNYLEVGAGILMVTIRMNQMAQPISELRAKWKLDALNKKPADMQAIANCNTAKSEITVNSNTPPEIVEILVKYGNNPEGIPALHYASLIGDENAVVLLLNYGASPNAFSRQILSSHDLASDHCSNPLTPLDFAAKTGHLNIMKILMERGAQINLNESFYPEHSLRWSPALYFAAKHDQGNVVSFLLGKGALLQPISNKGFVGEFGSALHIAVTNGSIQALDALFVHGVNIHTQLNQGTNLLHLAVDHNQLASIDWLVKHNLDVNSQNDLGQTALHTAMPNAKITTVERLLKNGANPNIKDRWNLTPLFSLGEYGPSPLNNLFDKAKLLIEYGADIHIMDDSNRTLFDRLIARCPSFNSPDYQSCINDSLNTAELLLENGYNINRKNAQNKTILYLLQHSYYGPTNVTKLQMRVIDWLIAHGAAV